MLSAHPEMQSEEQSHLYKNIELGNVAKFKLNSGWLQDITTIEELRGSKRKQPELTSWL